MITNTNVKINLCVRFVIHVYVDKESMELELSMHINFLICKNINQIIPYGLSVWMEILSAYQLDSFIIKMNSFLRASTNRTLLLIP